MNFLGFLTLFAIILLTVKAQTNTKSIEPETPAAPNATATEKPTTAPPRNYSAELQSVCKKCHCDELTNTLDCSHINLSKLPNDELVSLGTNKFPFETLRFDHNNLETVPTFPSLPAVKKLILSFNNISNITKRAFRELQSLEVLDLSNNRLLSKVLSPSVFEGKYSASEYEPFDKLKIIDLSSNQLHSLHPDIFMHFPNLETLNLASNTFQVINEVTLTAITSIPHLKNLDLSYMELSKLPEHLFHAPRGLENLNLTGNLLKTIPVALNYALNLKHLNLDENPLSDLENHNVFPILSNLESLSMSYIPTLRRIEKGALCGLENLKELMITNNPRLFYIHPMAFSHRPNSSNIELDYPQIEKLYLHNNHLTTLDHLLLNRWDKIIVADIRSNPWICDDRNEFLIRTLYPQISKITPVLSLDISCGSPPDLKNMKFQDIFQKKVTLRPASYIDTTRNDGAILIGILIGLLIGIPMTIAIVIMYRRGYFAFIGQPGPGDYSRAFYKRTELQDDYQI